MQFMLYLLSKGQHNRIFKRGGMAHTLAHPQLNIRVLCSEEESPEYREALLQAEEIPAGCVELVTPGYPRAFPARAAAGNYALNHARLTGVDVICIIKDDFTFYRYAGFGRSRLKTADIFWTRDAIQDLAEEMLCKSIAMGGIPYRQSAALLVKQCPDYVSHPWPTGALFFNLRSASNLSWQEDRASGEDLDIWRANLGAGNRNIITTRLFLARTAKARKGL